MAISRYQHTQVSASTHPSIGINTPNQVKQPTITTLPSNTPSQDTLITHSTSHYNAFNNDISYIDGTASCHLQIAQLLLTILSSQHILLTQATKQTPYDSS